MGIDGISSGVQSDYSSHISAARGANASPTSNSASDSSGMVDGDSVSISQQARDLLASGREAVMTANEMLSPQEMEAQKRASLYSKDDLNEVREKFRELMKSKEKVYADIDEILKEQGIKLAKNDTLRIEVDSKGGVLVGGVSDAKTAKAIEKALNEDKDLVKRIRTNRNMELGISGELERITGKSLTSYKNRLRDIQGGDVLPSWDIATGKRYTGDEMSRFEDQDLFLVDPEFMDAISEYMSIGENIDIATTGNLLSDPGEAMNDVFKGIISTIDAAFKGENKRTKLEDLKDFSIRTEEDQEWVDSLMLSLEGVDIRIDSAGAITIEGDFADDPAKNAKWTHFVEETIKTALGDNPVTGEKSAYTLASERLVNLYEDQFDQFGGAALGVTTITAGNALSIESHIANPEREEAVREEVEADVNAALEQMGMPLGIEVGVEVDEGGKIIVTGMTGDESFQEQVLGMVEILNSRVEHANPEDGGDGDTLGEIVGRLRANIDELKVYGPDGAREVQKSYSEE